MCISRPGSSQKWSEAIKTSLRNKGNQGSDGGTETRGQEPRFPCFTLPRPPTPKHWDQNIRIPSAKPLLACFEVPGEFLLVTSLPVGSEHLKSPSKRTIHNVRKIHFQKKIGALVGKHKLMASQRSTHFYYNIHRCRRLEANSGLSHKPKELTTQ